jgi:rod shape-determining protein MreD
MNKKNLKTVKLILGAVFISFFSLFLSSFFFSFLFFNLSFFFLFIPAVLFSLIERPEKNNSYFLAFFVGFWLDVFSMYPVGFHILILLAITFLIKVVVKRYVRI